jgi:RNA recognition motif-containing protein
MDFKLFVGNIPFDCTLNEFRNAFKKCKGYINADLINNSNSRCFGFVILKNKESMEELLIKNNIYVKDRQLRLTRYNNNTKNKENNYIKISNIPSILTINDIRREFENFSDVGKCFIDTDRNTGEYKDTGIVEIIDTDIFEQLIKIETLLINEYTINLSRYNNDIIKKNIQEIKNDYC